MCMCEITRDHFWLHVSLAVATVFPRWCIENATWWQRWDTTPRPRETEMASLRVTPPEPFDFTTPDEWPKWVRRFQRFRIASGLASGDEETQVNTLIYCMGDKADDILRSFQLSAEDEKNYETVREKFNGHFVAWRNIIYERAKFNSRCQEPDEPVETFVTALYNLAEHCGYEALHDEMIRDRIVVGIQDRKLSEKLQLDPTLTLEKAITTVRQVEAVKKQQPVIRKERTDDETISPIQAVRNTSNREQTPTCQWCGRSPVHDRRKCPARSVTCHRCNKKGHFQAVCRATPRARPVHLDPPQEDDQESFLGRVTNHNNPTAWTVTLQLNGSPYTFLRHWGRSHGHIGRHPRLIGKSNTVATSPKPKGAQQPHPPCQRILLGSPEVRPQRNTPSRLRSQEAAPTATRPPCH